MSDLQFSVYHAQPPFVKYVVLNVYLCAITTILAYRHIGSVRSGIDSDQGWIRGGTGTD